MIGRLVLVQRRSNAKRKEKKKKVFDLEIIIFASKFIQKKKINRFGSEKIWF